MYMYMRVKYGDERRGCEERWCGVGRVCVRGGCGVEMVWSREGIEWEGCV